MTNQNKLDDTQLNGPTPDALPPAQGGAPKDAQQHELQLDAMRELANIGAAHAATALSEIVDKTISLSIGRVNVSSSLAVQEVTDDLTTRMVVVYIDVLGDAVGGLVFVLLWDEAQQLVKLVANRNGRASDTMSEEDLMILKQAGCVLSAAYLQAIGSMTNMLFLPTVPRLVCGDADTVFNEVLKEMTSRVEVAFCVTNEIEESSSGLKGHWLLFTERRGLSQMLQALGLEPDAGTVCSR